LIYYEAKIDAAENIVKTYQACRLNSPFHSPPRPTRSPLLSPQKFKATTHLGQTTGPTTADWIIGDVWALMCVYVFTFSYPHADIDLQWYNSSTYWVSFFDDPTPDLVSYKQMLQQKVLVPVLCCSLSIPFDL
jgi:hypothetical protein